MLIHPDACCLMKKSWGKSNFRLNEKNINYFFFSRINKLMSVRSRGNKCYTRTNKAGVPYVVCNDPPKGSRGQVGVYQAENPTGKQDGRTAKNKAKKDKEIALRKVRKSMLTKEYGETIGEVGKNNPYTYNLETKGGRGNWRKPKKLKEGEKYAEYRQQQYPTETSMLRDLRKAGKKMDAFESMPLRYIKIRWLRETADGNKFLKDNDLERPDAFEMDSGAIAAQAQDLFVPAMKGIKTGKTGYSREAMGEVVGINAGKMTKENYDKWEAGKFTAQQGEIFRENALRYKHYLEIARQPIPDWVRDASL